MSPWWLTTPGGTWPAPPPPARALVPGLITYGRFTNVPASYIHRAMTQPNIFDRPHALYRLFNQAGDLLYIGCSQDPLRRVFHHITQQTWRYDVARVLFEWHPNWLETRRAEMAAIIAERPRYNKMVHDPASVGTTTNVMRDRTPTGRTRGDGVHCPRCGEPKEVRKRAYCASCMNAYMLDRRARNPQTTTLSTLSLINDDAGTPQPYHVAAAALGVNYETFKKRIARLRGQGVATLDYAALRKLTWRLPGRRRTLGGANS